MGNSARVKEKKVVIRDQGKDLGGAFVVCETASFIFLVLAIGLRSSASRLRRFWRLVIIGHISQVISTEGGKWKQNKEKVDGAK